MVPEQPGAEAVEGADPGLVVGVLQSIVHTPSDLLGGRGGEGEHEHLAPGGPAAGHEVGVEVDQELRLPGAGAGQDAHRPVERVGGEQAHAAEQLFRRRGPQHNLKARKVWGKGG